MLATQAAYFLYLFGVFYYKQYVKSQKESVQNENFVDKYKQLDDKRREVLKNDKFTNETMTNGKMLNSTTKKEKAH